MSTIRVIKVGTSRAEPVQVITIPATLAEFQAQVGGDIEVIHLPNQCDVYLNEEGKLKDLPANERMQPLLRRAGGIPGDWIAGVAIITGGLDSRGRDVSITDEQIREVKTLSAGMVDATALVTS